MRVKKTFAFNGTVISAKGWLKRKVIGKPVSGLITVLAQAEDFPITIGRLFKVGVTMVEAPHIRWFPGRSLKGSDYPYVVRKLQVSDVMEDASGRVNFSLNIVPWDKLDSIHATATAKSWVSRLMLDSVKMEGVATLFKSEELPNVARKV